MNEHNVPHQEPVPESEAVMPEEQQIPQELPILPLLGTVVFPMTIIPLAVGQEQSIRLIDDATVHGRMVAMVALRNPSERPEAITPDDFYSIGTAANLQKLIKMPDGTLRIAVQGIQRIEVTEITQTEPYFRGKVRAVPDEAGSSVQTEALMRNLQALIQQMASLIPQFPEELQQIVLNEDDPQRLANLLSIYTRLDLADRQALLEETNVERRLERLNGILTRELEVLRVGQQIQGQVNEKMGKTQREYILREQLRAIQNELGETDENAAEIARIREEIEAAGMSEEARAQALREVDRLERMNPAAADYGMIRTYLETLISLPWSKQTDDQIDVEVARRVLDEDHYDLEEIKERILEFLAVRELRRARAAQPAEADAEERRGEGAILCFVGPPGVGKTSLGRSIARAMNRKFLRISLGGVRDEAEIRGHRRTYIGAMPGTIIQSLRRVEVNNPLFMLDEIDKLGSDFRGDPASAMLEVLDPEQNIAFRDHYLDVAFDLSRVLFIATANSLATIPPPLRDRMEIIELSGYTVLQKLAIARRYLLPEQMRRHALTEDDMRVEDDALTVVIEEYTRESGVRNLEREVAAICRKVAIAVARNSEERPIVVDAKRARAYLGKPRYFPEVAERTDRPGVATGLVWTPVGGDIIFIEATRMPGNKGFVLTGQLGDVMKESAHAALSYVRAESERIGIPPSFFNGIDIHLHVPAGAIPKDGPSAGISMATALVSLLTGRPVKPDVAMTGEITLRGKVLPIGGLKEKALAAHRAGLRTVIIPKRNELDLDEIPPELRADMRFVPVENVDEVFREALAPRATEAPVAPADGEASSAEEFHMIDATTPVADEEPVEVNGGSLSRRMV